MYQIYAENKNYEESLFFMLGQEEEHFPRRHVMRLIVII